MSGAFNMDDRSCSPGKQFSSKKDSKDKELQAKLLFNWTGPCQIKALGQNTTAPDKDPVGVT